MSSDSSVLSSPTTGKPKKRKVAKACVYCKRSHMTCDEGRPCQRCLFRDIGALCRDTEPSTPLSSKPVVEKNGKADPVEKHANVTRVEQPLIVGFMEADEPVPRHDHGGGGKSEMPDGLEAIEESSFSLPSSQYFRKLTIHPPDVDPKYLSMLVEEFNAIPISQESSLLSEQKFLIESAAQEVRQRGNEFLYAAADPRLGNSPTERLNAILESKYEAGLLKPYLDGPAYQRAMDYCEMTESQTAGADDKATEASKRHWLGMKKTSQSMQHSKLREMWSNFHASIQGKLLHLSELDLLYIEEVYERSLIELDRYLSFLSTPTCVWRRNGEIVKCNHAFNELTRCHSISAGLGIYEILDYESYYNYTEKMISIAFDTTQKAVLTAANLLVESSSSHSHSHSHGHGHGHTTISDRAVEGHLLSTAFSFTIQRDSFALPCLIIGQFIPTIVERE